MNVGGRGLIYFDNAATTFPKPSIVYQEVDSFLEMLVLILVETV